VAFAPCRADRSNRRRLIYCLTGIGSNYAISKRGHCRKKPGGTSPAWPTLPSVSSNSVDLSLTNEKLDKIADMLGTLIQAQPAQAPKFCGDY